MSEQTLKQRLPGYIATGLLILTTSLWTYWSVMELYYEGWELPFPQPLAYLIPGAACLALTLVALTWPRVGGWLIVLIGGGFTVWWWALTARRGQLTLGGLLSMFPVSGLLVLTGVLFLGEARQRQRLRAEDWIPPQNWLRRNVRYVLAIGVPLLIVVGASLYWLPLLLGRHDDGGRGARLVEGNGVTLVWAPAGPGWNWRQEWGGYPSWDSLAFYGVPPAGLDLKLKPGYEDRRASIADMQSSGLCRYLSADGLTLLEQPQDIWRLPTVEEIIRSLSRDGENVGCTWDGLAQQADCRTTPDKETPLWAPDQPPIYYWTADESTEEQAYYVGYNGSIADQSKSWGNPRHGYRCVREP